jgi:hypothetical protein
MNQIDTAYY